LSLRDPDACRVRATPAITYVDGTLDVTARPGKPVTVLGVHWETRKLKRKKTIKGDYLTG
jgi:hypothetical protein